MHHPQTTSSFVSFIKSVCSKGLSDYIYVAIIVFMTIMVIFPLWSIAYLPLTDLPEHAAQLYGMIHSHAYEPEYSINWFTPYILSYGIGLLFSLFFSATISLKITLSLAVLGVPLATALLIKAIGGNRYWVLPSFAAAFSYSFYWGFLSFTVAVPIAVGFLAFCSYYATVPGSAKLFISGALLSLLLFFSHALVWAFSIVIAACILFVYNPLITTGRKLIPFIVIAPIVVCWLAVSGPSRLAVKTDSPQKIAYAGNKEPIRVSSLYEKFFEKLRKGEFKLRAGQLFSFVIGRTPEWKYITLSIVLLTWPWITGATFRRNWKYWLLPLAVVPPFMLLPDWFLDTAYSNKRFAVFLAPLSLFLFEISGNKRLGLTSRAFRYGLGLLLVSLLLFENVEDFAGFKKDDESFKAVLGRMEPNKKVMALIFDRQSDSKVAPAYLNQASLSKLSPAYLHFGAYYQGEKGGTVVPSFSQDPSTHFVPLRYRFAHWEAPSCWNPELFDWQTHRGDRYDYFLIYSKTNRDDLFSSAHEQVKLVIRDGNWAVYGNASGDKRESL